jgi:hypothetical protein
MRPSSDSGAASASVAPPEVLSPTHHLDGPLGLAAPATGSAPLGPPPGDEKPIAPWLRALLRAFTPWPI